MAETLHSRLGMAPAFDPNGLLDISRLKRTDYAKLPKRLSAFKAPHAPAGEQGLFARPPEFGDLLALGDARPVDDSLRLALESLLGGLSSGPGVIMGLFRCVNREDVVVRLYEPQKPEPDSMPKPCYFQVQRGHGQLAIKQGWVGKDAPLWLSLYVAVYYSFIDDRRAFYQRRDLGGADNAAWLVLYGKDSQRANYKRDTDKESARKKEAGDDEADEPGVSGPGSTKLLGRIFGSQGTGADSKPLAPYVFLRERGSVDPRDKQWSAFLAKTPLDPKTKLPKSLPADALRSARELRVWLAKQSGLSDDAIDAVLFFLEINQCIFTKGEERYLHGAKTVWDGISGVLRSREPVAIELAENDPLVSELKRWGGNGEPYLAVQALAKLELPSKEKSRTLRYLVLDVFNAPGREFAIKKTEGVRHLAFAPAKKEGYWLELDQVLRRAERILVGVDAMVALSRQFRTSSFTVELPRRPGGKIVWPKRPS